MLNTRSVLTGGDGQSYPRTADTDALLGVLCMYGSILSNQHCECGNKFTSAHKDKNGFYCPDCHTRPTRYHINARSFGLDYIFSDVKIGKVFQNYSDGLDVLVEMNRDFKKVHYDKKRFPKDNWMKEKIHAKLIENIIETWLINYDTELSKGAKSKSRVANVKKSCRHMLEFFKGCDIRDIGQDEVEKFYHSLLKRDLSSKYIDNILWDLRSLFLRYRPSDVVKFPVYAIVPKKEKQLLRQPREFAVLDKVPVRHGFLLGIMILLRTGMRIDELPALRVNNCEDEYVYVDKAFTEGKLRLSRKSGGMVVYRLMPELWAMLMEHCEGKKDEDFIFTYDSGHKLAGEKIPASRWYKVWTKACKDAGQRHITLQQASRHSKATRMMAAAQEKALQEIGRQLGDNPATVEKHYIIKGKRAE